MYSIPPYSIPFHLLSFVLLICLFVPTFIYTHMRSHTFLAAVTAIIIATAVCSSNSCVPCLTSLISWRSGYNTTFSHCYISDYVLITFFLSFFYCCSDFFKDVSTTESSLKQGINVTVWLQGFPSHPQQTSPFFFSFLSFLTC